MFGDICFVDCNNDGVIDWGDNIVDNLGDKKIIGNSILCYYYGINLGVDWKGFDLGIFFQGVGKCDFYLLGILF